MSKKGIDFIFQKERIASGIINAIGSFMTFFYLNVIDPVPTAKDSIRSLNSLDSFIFVAIFVIFFFSGINWGNKQKRSFRKWYSLIDTGENNSADVPQSIKQDVLNFPIHAAGVAALMWFLSSVIATYITGSSRVFIGLFGWGGLTAATLLYFVDDLLWRPIIPFFFPDGNLSEIRAFRLPMFWKLLIVFLFTGILLPTMLVTLTWQRAKALPSAPNPEVALGNLRVLQIFILSASVVTSIGLAFFVTRGVKNPLNALYKAMERVQRDDFDAKVVVTTNDELGYLGERFNQMTAELRQKKILFNANVQLREQLAKIKALEVALREQAIRDPLTGIFNRRYMEEVFSQELARASRDKKPLSIVLIDLDRLKKINDTYGHVDGGDQALLFLSGKIGALCRKGDTFCRYAGDEFLAILYDTSQKDSYKRAMEWKEAVSKEKIIAGEREFSITFSAGISEFPNHGLDAEKLIQNADKALYRAKDVGRNCIVVYSAD